ncbi:MAG TPA: hypothetical protein DF383_02805, partial [Deltaproteobacteria bacterium]|nr:hypothetical protein [Deltaproteobacteria bacterium]
MSSYSLFERFLAGNLPQDFRQKIFQVAFQHHQAIIDLLTLAIPEIEDLKPLVQDIRTEDPSFSWVKLQE